MQVGETDGTKDACKDKELELIDGLDFVSLERKQICCEIWIGDEVVLKKKKIFI